MTKRWIDILNHSGDADLGAALVRLARAAQTLHQYEAAAAAHHESMADQGGAADPEARPTGPVHMEVRG